MGTPSNARSRATRAALLDAARQILEERGFEALTMSAVATSAGVSRPAVYLHFTSRTDLVSGLFDHISAAEGLQESLQKVWTAPDALNALEQWAQHLARYHPRILAVDRAVDRLRRVDPNAAAHHKRVRTKQLESARRLAGWLQDEGHLAVPWTVVSARDMLFALISSDTIEALISDRRWTQRRLAEHLSVLLRRTFVGMV